MSKDKIEVSMNVYDIPILIEELEKADSEIKKLREENQQLKKQKDDVAEYIKKNNFKYCDDELCYMIPNHFNNLLRMLGEIDEL